MKVEGAGEMHVMVVTSTTGDFNPLDAHQYLVGLDGWNDDLDAEVQRVLRRIASQLFVDAHAERRIANQRREQS